MDSEEEDQGVNLIRKGFLRVGDSFFQLFIIYISAEQIFKECFWMNSEQKVDYQNGGKRIKVGHTESILKLSTAFVFIQLWVHRIKTDTI